MWNPITEIKKMVAFLRMFYASFIVIREVQKSQKQLQAINQVALLGEDDNANNGR